MLLLICSTLLATTGANAATEINNGERGSGSKDELVLRITSRSLQAWRHQDPLLNLGSLGDDVKKRLHSLRVKDRLSWLDFPDGLGRYRGKRAGIRGPDEGNWSPESFGLISESSGQPSESIGSTVEPNRQFLEPKGPFLLSDLVAAPSASSTLEPVSEPSTLEVVRALSTSEAVSGPSTLEAARALSTSEGVSGPSTSEGVSGPSTSEAVSGPSTSEAVSGPSTSEAARVPSTSEAVIQASAVQATTGEKADDAPRRSAGSEEDGSKVDPTGNYTSLETTVAAGVAHNGTEEWKRTAGGEGTSSTVGTVSSRKEPVKFGKRPVMLRNDERVINDCLGECHCMDSAQRVRVASCLIVTLLLTSLI